MLSDKIKKERCAAMRCEKKDKKKELAEETSVVQLFSVFLLLPRVIHSTRWKVCFSEFPEQPECLPNWRRCRYIKSGEREPGKE